MIKVRNLEYAAPLFPAILKACFCFCFTISEKFVNKFFYTEIFSFYLTENITILDFIFSLIL